MLERLLALLKIHPGEARMVGLVALFFALVDLGRAMGDSAADALFLRRFGVEYLPYMYMGLGVLTFLASLGYAAFLGRLEKPRFFPILLLGMALLLLVERAAIWLNLRELYPVIWLTVNISATLLGILSWTAAGDACDARQAKRLFSLFVTASILGGLLGSLAIGPAARLLGTDNLLGLYALLLAAGAALVRRIARTGFKAASPAPGSGFLRDIQAGFAYVRRAPLLQLLGASAVLFSILYFFVSFPFNKAVAAAYPDEASLAGFLGLFKGVSSALMFVAALLIANRLYARIGIVFALLLLPVTYLLGFAFFALSFTFTSAVIVRLAQLVVLSGIGAGAYGAFFNVVPADRRGQVRAFDAGVPAQIGIILSGILSLLGERLLSNTLVFGMGMVAAGLCALVVWRMRPRYAEALVSALRVGRTDVFTGGEKIFSGIAGDSHARSILTAALDDPDPRNQQLAAEMLARTGAVQAAPALMGRLAGAQPGSRAAFIRALGQLKANQAVHAVAGCLDDPDPLVRSAALEALPALDDPLGAPMLTRIHALLGDPDPAVRIQAATGLARCGDAAGAAQTLLGFLRGAPDDTARVRILGAFEQVFRADPAAGEAVEAVIGCLEAGSPAVRRAACRALAPVQVPAAFDALARRLSDPAAGVRLAAAESLRSAGPPAAPVVLAQLPAASDPGGVLAALPPGDPAIVAPLRAYARVEIGRLRAWRAELAALPRQGRAVAFLRSILEERAGQAEQRLVQTVGLLGEESGMQQVAQALHTADAETRATAVEALDTLGDAQLVKEILPLLEDGDQGHEPASAETERALRRLAAEGDPWLRAVAARAAGELELTVQTSAVEPVNGSAAGGESLPRRGGGMETLATLSLVERTLLLRDIPLFSDLTSDDLVQVAQIAQERWFDQGAELCREGAPGDELFIIAAGQVRVTHGAGDQARELAVRRVGDIIGEMAIIDSFPRAATLTADGEVRALVITAAAFRAILHDRPEVSMAVMRALSRRIRELI